MRHGANLLCTRCPCPPPRPQQSLTWSQSRPAEHGGPPCSCAPKDAVRAPAMSNRMGAAGAWAPRRFLPAKPPRELLEEEGNELMREWEGADGSLGTLWLLKMATSGEGPPGHEGKRARES